MNNKEYIYNNNIVEFFLGEDIMVNATEMAKVFDEKTSAFLRLEPTKKWINWLENNPIRAKRSADSTLRFGGKDVLEGEIKHRSADLVPILIVKRGGDDGGSVWMHRLLAIDFAMWLDINFKGWIVTTIDQLLFNYSLGKSAIAIERKELKEKLNKILISNPDNPQVNDIAVILKRDKQLKGDEFNLNIEFKRNLFDN